MMTPELAEIIRSGDVRAARPYIEQCVEALAADRWLAHELLFAHRHPAEPADFHPDLVADFWSDERYSIRLAFRGSAKSTIGEEDIAIGACSVAFRNCLIIGSSEQRAAERLASVAYELINNDLILLLFGQQRGKGSWGQAKIVTTKQVCIQAMGRDQDIRGIKFLDYRPDFVFIDDFEDKDSVQTPEGRAKTLRWFLAELLPACAPHARVRIRATPMDAESVPMRLLNEAGWPGKTYPVEHLGENGERVASWPSVWPLSRIDEQRQTYERVGELATWNREMMCRAVSDSDRVFQKDMMRVEPRVRVWEAVYGMIDPARTIRSQTSAMTGWAVWSWIKNRLVVWGADGHFLLPDEIVSLAFDLVERFDLVHLGIEEDGLEQFLLQPLRHEQVKRSLTIPYRGMRAPRDKLNFIRGMQPFFSAREAIFAQPVPVLESQLLNFPTGRIDVPNALAYALLMRPAAPIYDNFTPEHIVEDLTPSPGKPLFLAANATGAMTVAVLAQAFEGTLRILADWVFEGGPAERVADIAGAAALAADTSRYSAGQRAKSWEASLKAVVPDRMLLRRVPLVWVVPQLHSDRMMNVGLMQTIRRLPAEIRVGGTGVAGSLYIREALSRSVRGLPAVEISPNARWTLRALAGGYTRSMVRGRLQDFAEEGPYRVLMEGLEAFAGMIRAAGADDKDDDERQNMRVDERTGRRYASAMPAARVR